VGGTDALALLQSAQRGLRNRFEDFRGALGRRDDAACRMALADFHERLQRWFAAEEGALLPALRRLEFPGRDPQREVRLQYVQLRELTRHVRLQFDERGPLGDILGFVENLSRRFDAHEAEMLGVYYPAAAPALTAEELDALRAAAPTV
jgi:hypothetical protein